MINLQNIPWIVREKGSGTRKMLEDFIIQNGLTWDSSNIILELPSNESVREAVVAGAGATLISKHVVSLSIQTGLLKSSALNFSPRIYHMVVHKERPKTDAEKALIQFIHSTKHQAIWCVASTKLLSSDKKLAFLSVEKKLAENFPNNTN